MEEFARGSRERSQLRTHAGFNDIFNAETLGMAGRPSDRFFRGHFGSSYFLLEGAV